MVKKLTKAELAEARRLGDVEYDPIEQNIARFGELIDKLNEMISMKAAETEADLKRSQVQLEVLATLQKDIRNRDRKTPKVSEPDFKPLMTILAQIQAANAQRTAQAYHFDIQRGGRLHGRRHSDTNFTNQALI